MEKNKIIAIGVGVIVCIVIIVLVVVNQMNKIRSIESFEFSISDGTSEAKIYSVYESDGKKIISYTDGWGSDAFTKELDDNQTKELIKILNKCHVVSWSGFSEEQKELVNSSKFSFSLEYNGEKKIEASGYNKTPSSYSKFKKKIEEFYNNIKNQS